MEYILASETRITYTHVLRGNTSKVALPLCSNRQSRRGAFQVRDLERVLAPET